MGQIWIGVQRSLDRKVALKFLGEQFRDDADVRRRFLDEARKGARVKHTNIADVYDSGVYVEPASNREVPWLAMEFIDGDSLAALAKDGAPWTPERVTLVFEGIRAGLGAAHAAGVLHLDLKPENLMLARAPGHDGPVLKIVDFGIAKVLGGGHQSTRNTSTFASFAWAAPEQQVAGHDYETGAFALDPASARWPTASERTTSLKVNVALPAGFDDWFARCTKVDPKARYTNARECCDALLAVLHPVTASAPPPSVAPPEPQVTKTEPMRMPKPGVGMPPRAIDVRARSGAPASTPPTAALRRRPMWHWFAGVAAIGVTAALVLGVGPSRLGQSRGDAGVALDDVVAVRDVPRPPPPIDMPPPLPRCSEGMVAVPEGEFTMGTDTDAGVSDEHPAHRVHVSAFCIDRTEVTVRAFRAYWAAPGPRQPAGVIAYPGGRTVTVSEAPRVPAPTTARLLRCTWNARAAEVEGHPINCVDWPTAQAYCAFREGRLPTEAEWEYAARGADGRVFPWGFEAPEQTRGNFCGPECERPPGWSSMPGVSNDGYDETAPVGRFLAGASPFGALDMAGNVMEWVADRWATSYELGDGSVLRDPAGPTDDEPHDDRVVRGGGWFSLQPWQVRATRRTRFDTTFVAHVGFRCAVSPRGGT